jgi:hypothetical protein
VHPNGRVELQGFYENAFARAGFGNESEMGLHEAAW